MLRETYAEFIRNGKSETLKEFSASDSNLVNIFNLDDPDIISVKETFDVCNDLDKMNYYGKV